MSRLDAIDMSSSPRHEGRTAFRYLIVTVGGYLIDFGISLGLVWLSDIPLVAAAAIGFSFAVIANYLAHEFWTFADRPRSDAYGSRFLRYVGVACLTLAVRVGVIAIFDGFATSDMARTALLVAAAGVSVGLNYLLTRAAVFR